MTAWSTCARCGKPSTPYHALRCQPAPAQSQQERADQAEADRLARFVANQPRQGA